MIILEGVTAVTASKKNARPFLWDVDLILPSNRRIALLGTGREETPALMHLLSGLLPPRAGRVIRRSKVSFPVGFLGGFVPELAVRENVAYLARLYGADIGAILKFMRTTADLGAILDAPYGKMPRQNKSDLAQILAYALPFDTYLLLDQPKPSAQSGLNPAYQLYEARRRVAGMIIPTRSKSFADEHCELALVFEKGKLRLYDKLDEAFKNAPDIKETNRESEDADHSDGDTRGDVSSADASSSSPQEPNTQVAKTERRRARRKRLALREKRLARKRAARDGVA